MGGLSGVEREGRRQDATDDVEVHEAWITLAESICFVYMFRVFARRFQESLNSWSSAVLLRKPRCWRYVLYKWHEMIRFWSQTLVCLYRVGMLCAHNRRRVGT
ncbi:unnamed protein product [Ectocarpus sp. 13 AM-2016]